MRRGRLSPATKCATSATSSPRSWPKAASRRKTPPRRSRSITSRCQRVRSARGGRARRAAPARAIRHQHRVRDRARQPGEDRSRDGRRRQSRRARPAQQPARRQSARAARLSLRLRCGERSLHALRHHPAAALSAALALGLHAAHSRAQNPRHLARRRRRFRREGKFRRRGLDHRLGRATAAPAGALDRDAHRYILVRRAGARSRHPRPHGFRPRGPHRRHAGRYARGARRLSEQFRAEHSRQFVSADHHRALPHAEPAFARARRLYQHRAGRRLSRLRPAGGDLDQRAADRARRPRARHRCGRDAPAQSDRPCRLSLSGARRAHL